MKLWLAILALICSMTAAVAFAPWLSGVGVSAGSGTHTFSLPSGHVLHFITTTGSDSADGLAPTVTGGHGPWATPLGHALSCGDVILVGTGTYDDQFNSWDTSPSSCPSTTGGIDGTGGIYVATFLCSGNVGTCIVSSSDPGCNPTGGACGNGNIDVGVNNIAIEGFQSTSAGSQNAHSYVADGCGLVLHHIAFINDIAQNTSQGYTIADCGKTGAFGVDEWAVVGSIAQNAAFWNGCAGAVDYVGPNNNDASSGTHTLIEQTFSFNNPLTGCSSDGEDFLEDSPDAHSYTGQVVFRNLIGVHAARMGLHIFTDTPGNNATIVENVTLYDDQQVGTDTGGDQGDMSFFKKTTGSSWPGTLLALNNISLSPITTQGGVSGKADIDAGFLASVSGATPTGVTIGTTGNENVFYNSATPAQSYANSNGTYAGVNFLVNPNYTNISDLITNHMGTPSCSSFTNTVACEGWNFATQTSSSLSMINDLIPTASQAIGKGYIPPQPCVTSDAVFPAWLKGIIFLQASAFTTGATITETEGLMTKPCAM